MTIVTVFRSRLRPGVADAYAALASEMSRLAHSIDGFIDEKNYESSDGERVTIVRFRDRGSHQQWARNREHVAAQERGRDEFYAWYHISVSHESYCRSLRFPSEF